MPPFAPEDVAVSLQPVYSPFSSLAIARGSQIVTRSSVAALTFLVWDNLITFGDEVEYIWPRPWSYVKITYFLLRYFPLLVQISLLFIGSDITPHLHFTPHDCFILQVYQGVASVIIIGLVDAVLVLRVHALYHAHKRIRRVVSVAFFFEIVGMISGLVLALPGIQYDNICLNTHAPGTLVIYIGSSIIFQFLLFGLTLAKFLDALRAGWGDIPLIKLFARDGTWAFFLLFCFYVAQLRLYMLKNHDYAGVLFGWLITAFSFCGYRVLINLQHLGEQKRGASGPSSGSRTCRTDTKVEFTTHIESTPPVNSNFELSMVSPDVGRIFGTSQISPSSHTRE